MRRIVAGVLALSLAAPALRAQDPPKANQPGASASKDGKAGGAQTPQDQFQALTEEFGKELREVATAFRSAKDDKVREELKAKAFKLPEKYAPRVLALAEKNAKDPVAPEALTWVAVGHARYGLPAPPQAKEAIDRLIRDHIDSEQMATVVTLLGQSPDGEAVLRQIREKAKSQALKLHAAFSIAQLLREVEEPTEAQSKEAEALLAEVVAKGKGVEGLSEDVRSQAEKVLWEVRNLAIGKPAPDAESTDLEGKKVRLSDYKGKVVVLDFWATWCGPCVSMIPHERDLVKKMAGKPFAFISVSADEDKDTLKEFVEKEKMTWSHWWNGRTGGVVAKWNIQGFPTIYVIDAKGIIRAKMVGAGPATEKKIDETVEKLVQEAGDR